MKLWDMEKNKQEKKQLTETVHMETEEAQASVFFNKNFKFTITIMYKDLKKIISEELNFTNNFSLKNRVPVKKKKWRKRTKEKF